MLGNALIPWFRINQMSVEDSTPKCNKTNKKRGFSDSDWKLTCELLGIRPNISHRESTYISNKRQKFDKENIDVDEIDDSSEEESNLPPPPTKKELLEIELDSIKSKKLAELEIKLSHLLPKVAEWLSENSDLSVDDAQVFALEFLEDYKGYAKESIESSIYFDHSDEWIESMAKTRGYGMSLDFKDTQYEGIKFAMRKFVLGSGCIIAHEMGLGKSLLTIVLERLITDSSHGTSLIIAPPGVSNNWRQECTKFFGTKLKVLFFESLKNGWFSCGGKNGPDGKKSKGEITSDIIEKHDLVITHFHALTSIWDRVVKGPVKDLNSTLSAEYLKRQGGTNKEETQRRILKEKFPLLDWSSFERSYSNSKWVNVSMKREGGSIPMVGALLGFHWKIVIVDEAHKMKNPNSLLAEMCHGLCSDYRLALTGTPTFNYTRDLWSILRFIKIPNLESFKDFTKYTQWLAAELKQGVTERELESDSNFESVVQVINSTKALKERYSNSKKPLSRRDQSIKGVLDVMEKWMQKITKNDLAQTTMSSDQLFEEKYRYNDQGWTMLNHSIGTIPPAYEKVIRIDSYDALINVHDSIRLGKRSEFNALADKNKHHFMGETIMYLRMLTSHPDLVGDSIYEKYCDPKDVKAIKEGHLQKLKELIEYYLSEVQPHDQKMVVFVWFKTTGIHITKKLNEMGIDAIYVDGDAKKAEKLEICTRFSNGDKYKVLVATHCISVGLNIPGANHCAIMDPWWNIPEDQQCYHRLLRPGQKYDVRVLRFILRGTVEEKILKIAQNKENYNSALSFSARKDLLGF